MTDVRRIVTILCASFALFLAWKGFEASNEPKSGDAGPALNLRSGSGDIVRPQQVPIPTADRADSRASRDDSIESRVHALAASHDPAEYLEVFESIKDCLKLERDKELTNTKFNIVRKDGKAELEIDRTKVGGRELEQVMKSCATMSGRTRLDRFDLLAYAVEHHAPGAIVDYIAEGPLGDPEALKERATDPQVIKWRQDAIGKLKEEIELGYPDALLTSVSGLVQLGVPLSPEEMYVFHLATNKVVGEINHNAGPYSKEFVEGLAEPLSPQQKHDALLRAEKIFLSWKQRSRR